MSWQTAELSTTKLARLRFYQVLLLSVSLVVLALSVDVKKFITFTVLSIVNLATRCVPVDSLKLELASSP